MSALAGLLEKRLFLLGGPGGVGKTTLAASMAVALAERGHRTIVLTVDPARRLAQALGFEHFSDEVQAVPLPGGKGKLFATMLDSKRYFDRIVERLAKSSAQRDKILANPLYQIMVDHLGGTHEYAAMERLLEFAQDPQYEKIVLDTPPTQNAVDLFSAPQRLADFMDNSVLRWFQGGNRPLAIRLFQSSSRLAIRLLERVLGNDFISLLGQLMDDIEGMQSGFRSRNLEVFRLLQSNDAGFLMVSHPSQARFEECQAFLKVLHGHEIQLSAVLLNRVVEVVEAPGDLSGEVGRWVEYELAMARNQSTWRARFREEIPVPTLEIPYLSESLHDLKHLSEIGHRVISSF